jgi:pimeloyl-ACP methyl ester carboxylesterase
VPGPARSFRSIPAGDAALLKVGAADGATLALYRLTNSADGPPLLCGHATGMAAGSYLPWLRMLGTRARVYAFDSRGHGGSGGDAESVTIDTLARDLKAVAEAACRDAKASSLFYAAHSISGVAALHLGAALGIAPWRDLILFEPPVMVGEAHPRHAFARADTLARAERTERRRPSWPSRAEYRERLSRGGVFARFRPDMLDAHVAATLEPDGANGFRLACDPAVEGAYFRSVRSSAVWHGLPRFPMPARFVGGDPDLPDPGAEQARWVTMAAPDIAARVPGARFIKLGGCDHMMVCERPDACRDLVFAMIDEAGG